MESNTTAGHTFKYLVAPGLIIGGVVGALAPHPHETRGESTAKGAATGAAAGAIVGLLLLGGLKTGVLGAD